MSKYVIVGLLTATALSGCAGTSRSEMRANRQDVREQRQDVRDAQRYGSREDVREEREDLRDARRERRQDRRNPD
jgi:hypothetical protein